MWLIIEKHRRDCFARYKIVPKTTVATKPSTTTPPTSPTLPKTEEKKPVKTTNNPPTHKTEVPTEQPSSTTVQQSSRPMMYGAYHDIFNASNQDNSEQNEYRIVGYICETDTFSWTQEGKQGERLMNKVSAGDIIAIKNAGAYCFSMASQYNSRLLPAEVLVIDGEAKLIRKRDTFEDIVRNLVSIDV